MAPSSTPSSTARPTSGPQVARTPASSSLRAGLRRGNAEAAPQRLVLVGAVCVGAGRERDRPTHGPAGADTRRLVDAGPAEVKVVRLRPVADGDPIAACH